MNLAVFKTASFLTYNMRVAATKCPINRAILYRIQGEEEVYMWG